MSYHHTQRGWIHFVLISIAALLVALQLALPPVLSMRVLIGIAAGVFVLLAASFRQLTVSDEGDRLAIRFGPLPLFQRTIRYDEITSAVPARTALIDGIGIHYLPGRGTTYNIAGRECVKLTRKGRTIRIGTDDAEGLSEFLRGRIASGRFAQTPVDD